MTSIYDVAVVGGGVAGASAVIALRQADINVLWIRPPWQAGLHKVGESLAPAANPILASLGLSEIVSNSNHRRANATFSAWGQAALVERNSAVHLEGAGSIIDRVRFEEDLSLLANASGATMLEDKLQSIHEAPQDQWWTLQLSSNETVKARFLIDATGRNQVIGRDRVRCEEAAIETVDHLAAAYGFLRQKDDCNVIPTPATLLETVEDGWWYASLLPTGHLTINFYSDPDILPHGLTKSLPVWQDLIQQTQHIAYWIEDAEFVIDSPPKLTSAATRCLTPAAAISRQSNGWAAIGDAAVAFDPLSAHGMTTALWAAARMKDVVQAYLADDHQVLASYAAAVDNGWRDYIKQRDSLYKQEKRFQDCEFWARRR